ncbi:hypothetical protein BB559_002517 [Furculomyces boomerangus]|uniref:Serine aminopeptidase S33 domain-containing protein n=2 Tax=Harpellales TaxID=61421 RepID=A0A2T9YUN3_9FUNG|nr:hypothetical protein BB559_002517 [Furculomyces boomerangus]PVZ98737.1 hypothetical protein BB558_005246 [Smittium angustum]
MTPDSYTFLEAFSKFIFFAFLVLFGLVVFGLATLWFFQNEIIYPANVPANSKENVPLPSQYNLDNFEDVRIRANDKVVIRGYLIKRPTDEETTKADTILYLHANSGNMGHRLPIAKALYEALGCNVFMLSYRGYGLSGGHASESGIKLDIEAAISYLRSNPLTQNSRVVIFGQALGGAVGIDTISKFENEFAGLILENTFLSVPELFAYMMPLIKWAKLLVMENWNSEKKIKEINKVPILFLTGEKDEVNPPKSMETLYEIAKSNTECKTQFKSFPNGRHNDTCTQEGYFETISEWWNTFITPQQPYKQTGVFDNMFPKQVKLKMKQKPRDVEESEKPLLEAQDTSSKVKEE